MSRVNYFVRFVLTQILIKEGHDPDTSPEVAALRTAYINAQHGGKDKVNVSTVGVPIS